MSRWFKVRSFPEYIKRHKEQCSKCKYSEDIHDPSIGSIMCGYLNITGHRRNCPAENCEKFERK